MTNNNITTNDNSNVDLLNLLLEGDHAENRVRLLTLFQNLPIENKITTSNLTQHNDLAEYNNLYNYLNTTAAYDVEFTMLNALYILYLNFNLTAKEIVYITLNELVKYLVEDDSGVVIDDISDYSTKAHSMNELRTVCQYADVLEFLPTTIKVYSTVTPCKIFKKIRYLKAALSEYLYSSDSAEHRIDDFCSTIRNAWIMYIQQSNSEVIATV